MVSAIEEKEHAAVLLVGKVRHVRDEDVQATALVTDGVFPCGI